MVAVRETKSMTDPAQFLADRQSQPYLLSGGHRFSDVRLFVGSGSHGLEVVVARSVSSPVRSELLDAWKSRRGQRAAPVVFVALHPSGAALCGATGEKPPIYEGLDIAQSERLCREALDQPDRHAALRFLAQALASLETTLPGLNNEGLLALHELQQGVPSRGDWSEARRNAGRAVGKRDQELLRALGFKIERLDNLTSLLRSGGTRTALAVMLRETESPESGSDRFNSLSPISYAFKKADDESLSWVVVVQGNRLRLYATAVDAGVGRRGRTETYVECQPTLLSNEHLPYLWLLYSADALAHNGSLHEILEGSQRFSGDLAERLRERIYDHVVPELAQGVATERGLDRPTTEQLRQTYEMALTILFRLLFIAYAEDRDLLPYRTNEAYRRRSLKQKAQELAKHVADETPISVGTSHWDEVKLLWQAVAVGNSEWGVPAYDGGLFAEDPAVSECGAALAEIALPNRVFEEALRWLLVIETPEGGPGPVDFRSLGVREFGTIYEGLLESELGLADTNLILKKQKNGDVYFPARENDTPEVMAGQVFLHNRSGARKSSGSYYTKSFAVEHLLSGALEPAIEDHFKRLDGMDETDAGEAFFDFRVADIAMGSGHFLVGAIDRVEKRMADYLANRPLPGVRTELEALRDAAYDQIGEAADRETIEDSRLLRRLIARRCIYGVDINGLSVQLARLAVWIHTFVPGLPLSFLDHTLVHGNSLVGVGSIDEIKNAFAKTEGTLFRVDAESLLGTAQRSLRRLANCNDATLRDVGEARTAALEARTAISDTENLCNLIVAEQIEGETTGVAFILNDWPKQARDPETLALADQARKDLSGLHALHFPVTFPEVFLRRHPGFDVIIGNPPWQEATIEEHAFWARHFPGLRGRAQRDQELEKATLRRGRPDLVKLYGFELDAMEKIRQALINGNYPGMSTGDPDFYKAFCWRFWNLSRQDSGYIGVVLPRSVFSAKGSTDFRKMIFTHSEQVDVTTLVNRREWVFSDVTSLYTISLTCISRGEPKHGSIRLRGPYSSREAYSEHICKPAIAFDHEEVLSWNDTASLPLLPNQDSVSVFAQLRKSPRLDWNPTEMGGGGRTGLACASRPRNGRHTPEAPHGLRPTSSNWRARPDAELHATAQKGLMMFVQGDNSNGLWPVYKGESFDLWTPDTGIYYAYADPQPALDWLQAKRVRAGKRRGNSPHREFPMKYLRDRSTLPCLAPRIAFRDITNRANQRTVIASLLPPNIFITNKGPYFLWPRGDEKDQAFLLGILSSIPLDWYARRFVEINVNFFIINPFPVPRPERSSKGWQRVVELAGRLACPDERFAEWASAVDVECGPLVPERKDDMIYELDAVVAHLYGLKESQIVHIFETFHERRHFDERHLDAVLRHFRAWDGKISGPR